MENPNTPNNPNTKRHDEAEQTERTDAGRMGMSGGGLEPGQEDPQPTQAERTIDDMGGGRLKPEDASSTPTSGSAARQGTQSGSESNQSERTGMGGTVGGGLQGTQSGGTSQTDRMNPGPSGTGGTSEDQRQTNQGEIQKSGMGGFIPDMGLSGEPPQAGANTDDTITSNQDMGTSGNARQDTNQGGNQSGNQDRQDQGEARRMGTGGGRDDIGLPRKHVADCPQEVRESEGEPWDSYLFQPVAVSSQLGVSTRSPATLLPRAPA